MNRREFLKSFAVGVAAMSVTPSGLLVPETVIDRDDRFRDDGNNLIISVIDECNRIAASRVASGVHVESKGRAMVVHCNDVWFPADVFAEECVGRRVAHVGVSIPMGGGHRYELMLPAGMARIEDDELVVCPDANYGLFQIA